MLEQRKSNSALVIKLLKNHLGFFVQNSSDLSDEQLHFQQNMKQRDLRILTLTDNEQQRNAHY